MIVQIVVFVIRLPPATVTGYFTLLGKKDLLGLLSLDLLCIVDSGLLVLTYLALCMVLRSAAESAMLVGAALGIAGIAAHFAFNPGFEVLCLRNQYAAATTQAQRPTLVAAGQAIRVVAIPGGAPLRAGGHRSGAGR
jgi:hypothetical protein